MSASHGNYQGMSHQQLFDYANSGNPGAIDGNHSTITSYATDLDQATTDLGNTLSAIQQEWTGAASDNYFEQAQAVVKSMQGQVSDAQNTAKALGTAYSALATARHNMPHPPSKAEELLASVNHAPAGLNVVAGVMTDGVSALASKQAQDAINSSHQKAISTMQALAAGYEQAQSELPNVTGGYDKKKDDGSQSQQQTSNQIPLNGGAGAVVPVFYPAPVGLPVSGAPATGGNGGSAKNPGVGAGNPLPGTSLQGAGATTGSGSGPIGAVPPPSGLAGGAGGPGASGFPGGLAAYSAATTFGDGGSNAASSSGLFGEDDDGGYGAAGLGAGGGAGAGAGAEDVAGVGVGAGGEGFSGEGAGMYGVGGAGSALAGGADADAVAPGLAGSADGFGSVANPDSAGSAGALDGAGGEAQAGAGKQGSEGMMGGAGRGGSGGGSGDEQRDGSQYIKEDRDYWYGDANYAPPGGLIE